MRVSHIRLRLRAIVILGVGIVLPFAINAGAISVLRSEGDLTRYALAPEIGILAFVERESTFACDVVRIAVRNQPRLHDDRDRDFMASLVSEWVHIGIKNPSSDGYEEMDQAVLYGGWPVRSFWCRLHYENATDKWHSSWAQGGITVLGGSHITSPAGTRAVPFWPIWKGLCVNTMLAILVASILMAIGKLGFRCYRRMYRMCPCCGYRLYDGMNVGGCPECGWNRPASEQDGGGQQPDA